jgi:biotin carboxyl carrier protein
MIVCQFLTVIFDEERHMRYQFKIDAQDFTVDVGDVKAGVAQVVVNGRSYDVTIENSGELAPPTTSDRPARATAPPTAPAKPISVATAGEVIAPIPGLILDVRVHEGESVSSGQTVATMEAMKMENNLTAPVAGIVQEIRVKKGAEVATGDVIMRIG